MDKEVIKTAKASDNILLLEGNKGKEVLKIDKDGKVWYNDKLIAEDKEVYTAMVRFLTNAGFYAFNVPLSVMESALNHACDILASRGSEIPGFKIQSKEEWKHDILSEAENADEIIVDEEEQSISAEDVGNATEFLAPVKKYYSEAQFDRRENPSPDDEMKLIPADQMSNKVLVAETISTSCRNMMSDHELVHERAYELKDELDARLLRYEIPKGIGETPEEIHRKLCYNDAGSYLGTDSIYNAMRVYAAAFHEQLEDNSWIDVETEKPETSGDYIGYDTYYKRVGQCSYDKNNDTWEFNGSDDCMIIRYQKLPLNPKGV